MFMFFHNELEFTRLRTYKTHILKQIGYQE